MIMIMRMIMIILIIVILIVVVIMSMHIINDSDNRDMMTGRGLMNNFWRRSFRRQASSGSGSANVGAVGFGKPSYYQ